MYYELYIDLFFLENFMMDSLILLAVNRIMKRGRGYGGILLGGALGSALTCLVTAAPFPAVVKIILFHLVINSLMIIIGLRVGGAAQFAKAFALLYFSAVFLGGIMQLFRPFMRYVSVFYAAAALSYLTFSRLWRAVLSIGRQEGNIFEVELYTGKRQIRAKALWDTGNSLRDDLTGYPVNILDPGFAGLAFRPEEKMKGIRYIPYRCVSGEDVMQIFRIEKMCIHMEGEYWIMDPILGIGRQEISAGEDYQMILNPGIFEQ